MIPRPYTGPNLIDPTAIPEHPIVSEGEADSMQFQWSATSQTWSVCPQSETATLNLPITYWPIWRAFNNGQAIIHCQAHA